MEKIVFANTYINSFCYTVPFDIVENAHSYFSERIFALLSTGASTKKSALRITSQPKDESWRNFGRSVS